MQQFQSDHFSEQWHGQARAGARDSGTAPRRLLAPVKRAGDIDAALAYVLAHGGGAALQLTLLHVTPSVAAPFAAAAAGDAGLLLAAAEARCLAVAVAHESHLLSGELAFSILDAAEMLACEAILLTYPEWRPWHGLFPPPTVRALRRLRRDVPLVIIGADGAVIGGERP